MFGWNMCLQVRRETGVCMCWYVSRECVWVCHVYDVFHVYPVCLVCHVCHVCEVCEVCDVCDMCECRYLWCVSVSCVSCVSCRDVGGWGRDPRKQQDFCTTVKKRQEQKIPWALDVGVCYSFTGTRFPCYISLSTMNWESGTGNLFGTNRTKRWFRNWESEGRVWMSTLAQQRYSQQYRQCGCLPQPPTSHHVCERIMCMMCISIMCVKRMKCIMCVMCVMWMTGMMCVSVWYNLYDVYPVCHVCHVCDVNDGNDVCECMI